MNPAKATSRDCPIAVIVNPFAGAGGRLGWKGTDWPLPLKILERGVPLTAPDRARRYLEALARYRPGTHIKAPRGAMGWGSLGRWPGPSSVLDCVPCGKWPTTPEDTVRCASEAVERGACLLVFVGGDGTARLVVEAVDKGVPVLGVPAGVKVYSGVFAYTPEEAAELTRDYLDGRTQLVEREVLDIDEDAFRADRLQVRLYATALVPASRGLVASGKTVAHGPTEEEEMEEIAEYFAETYDKPCTLIILGPGRTTMKIAEKLGVRGKTLLGVDAIHNHKLIGKDLDEEQLLNILSRHKGKKLIVISPIGGQGFILGRGNQQISPRVLEHFRPKEILIVSTPSKLSRLKTLRIDTGDPKIDERYRGYMKILTGFNKYKIVRVY